MNALPLYNMTTGLCACGNERYEDNDSCIECLADAALSEPEAAEIRAELAEMTNVRSKHCHSRHELRGVVAHV